MHVFAFGGSLASKLLRQSNQGLKYEKVSRYSLLSNFDSTFRIVQ